MRQTLTALRNGVNDPTTRIEENVFWRAMRTPEGTATIRIELMSNQVVAHAVGRGAEWILQHADAMIGLRDTFTSVEAIHDAVKHAQAKFGALRFAASLDPFHELIPAVLGQRVTAAEAVTQWRRICSDFGEEAPSSAGWPQLRLVPDAARLAAQPYWVFHRYGIERRRALTIVNVARHSRFLADLAVRAANLNSDSEGASERIVLRNALQEIPGVGQWTAAVAGSAAFGDGDALCVGDFHAKNTVAFALTGAHRGTDDLMCELLATYAPHRGRVLRWLELDGWYAPAHGPRRRNLPIAHF